MTNAATTDTAGYLRHWATGVYPVEAGVELLIRAHRLGPALVRREAGDWDEEVGRPFATGGAYIQSDGLRVLAEKGGALSGGERRLARIAASLLGVHRGYLRLVLAAGSHGHSKVPAWAGGRQKSEVGAKRHIASLDPWRAQ